MHRHKEKTESDDNMLEIIHSLMNIQQPVNDLLPGGLRESAAFFPPFSAELWVSLQKRASFNDFQDC